MSPGMWLAEGFPQTHLDLHQEAEDSGNYLCCYGAITLRDIDADEFTNVQNEETRAVYAMSEFGWYDLKYPISGNIGVRAIETDMSTEGWVVYPDTVTDIEGKIVGRYLCAFTSSKNTGNQICVSRVPGGEFIDPLE